MTTPILTQIDLETKDTYSVFYDEYENFDIDFESEEDKKDYLNKFETGELSSYIVVQSELCECCNHYNEIDSCGGFHASTAEEAIHLFRGDHDKSNVDYVAV